MLGATKGMQVSVMIRVDFKWIFFHTGKPMQKTHGLRFPLECYNMDEPCGHYAEWNKPVTKGHKMGDFHLEEVLRVVEFIKSGSRMMFVRGWREED